MLDINTQVVEFFDIPVNPYITAGGKKGRRLDSDGLLRLIRDIAGPNVACVVLETQQAFFKGSASSTFKLAHCFGSLEMAFRALRFNVELVKPRMWKKDLGLKKTADMTQSQVKECSRQLALHLFPGAGEPLRRKMDHNRAEALLIAEWGRRHVLRKYVSGYKYRLFPTSSEPISHECGEEIHRITTF
jgi:hypothetical protein